MSVQMISAVLDCRHPELGSARRMVLVALANRAGAEGDAWPSQELVAGECGMGLRTLKDHLAWLEVNGYITRKTQNLGRGKGSRTTYRLHVLRLVAGAEPALPLEDVAGADNAGAIPAPANNARANNDTYGCRKLHLTNRQEPISKASALESAREKVSNPQKGRGKVRGTARQTSIPENWQPGPMGICYASGKGLTPKEIAHECEKFKAHYGARRGTKAGRFSDWHKVWTGWILRAIDYGNVSAHRPNGPANGGHAPDRQSPPTSFAALRQRVQSEGRGNMGLHDQPAGGEMEGGYIIEGQLAGDPRGNLFDDGTDGR